MEIASKKIEMECVGYQASLFDGLGRCKAFTFTACRLCCVEYGMADVGHRVGPRGTVHTVIVSAVDVARGRGELRRMARILESEALLSILTISKQDLLISVYTRLLECWPRKIETTNRRKRSPCSLDAEMDAREGPQKVTSDLNDNTERDSVQPANASPDAYDDFQRRVGFPAFEARQEKEDGWQIIRGDTGESRPPDEEVFVQELLPHRMFDGEGLRQHLCPGNVSDVWTQKVLGIKVPERQGVFSDACIDDGNTTNASKTDEKWKPLFPTGDMIPRSPSKNDRSLCQIIDVGVDGGVLPSPREYSKASLADWPFLWGPQPVDIWEAMRSMPFTRQEAAGRITIVNELAPALIAALHYIMFNTFPVRALFQDLYLCRQSFACMFGTMSNAGQEHVISRFCLKSITLIDQDYECFDWQESSPPECDILTGIRISTCSSHVLLAIGGRSIRKYNEMTSTGWRVFDIFAPWQILNFRCCPIQGKSGKSFSKTFHIGVADIGSGPEAFMAMLRNEYGDAYQRLEAVYRAVSQSMTNSKVFSG